MSLSKEAFQELSPRAQKRALSDQAQAAMWRELPDGTTGSLVLQLRDRGAKAERRANLFLGVLLASILVGFLYYASLLLVPQYWNAQRSTYEAQVEIVNDQIKTMNNARKVYRETLQDILFFAARPVKIAGPHYSLGQLSELNDGRTLVALKRASSRYATVNSILRSTDAGLTWQELPNANQVAFQELIVLADNTLIAIEDNGSILRSQDVGESWQTTQSPIVFGTNILRKAPTSSALFAISNSAIVRSDDGGKSWETLSDISDEYFYDLVIQNDEKTLIALGGEVVTRSDDGGDTWETYPFTDSSPVGEITVLPDGQNMIGISKFGSFRTSDGGKEWQAIVLDQGGRPIEVQVLPDGITILAVGSTAGILLSSDKGKNWKPIDVGTQKDMFGLKLLKDGITVVAVGRDGVITRTQDAGKTWQTHESFTTQDLYDLNRLQDGTSLVTLNRGNSITLSLDAGETWRKVLSGADTSLVELYRLRDKSAVIAFDEVGTIVRFDNLLSEALNDAPTESTAAADQALIDFIDTLPGNIPAQPNISQLRTQILTATTIRPQLEQDLLKATTALAEINSGGFSLAQRRQDFDLFMASCLQGSEDSADVTKACADAYAAQNSTEDKSWWATIAETGPPAILLLFLLATLGGLFRYNLRLAGFHNSRADALELLASYDDKAALDTLTALSTALAADKVEFGKANTPADQAVEMFKAFAARSK
ncbi:MAG: hypothetical protein GY952_09245 [Rhodobacteraceae bacterium]|nr:hypothetical protein [Paracoccaceae bacterium]